MCTLKKIASTLILIFIGLVIISCQTESRQDAKSAFKCDYDVDINKIEKKLKNALLELEDSQKTDSPKQAVFLKCAKLKLQKATLSGSVVELADILKALNTQIDKNMSSKEAFIDADMILLRAHILSKIHRFKEAERDLNLLLSMGGENVLADEAIESMKYDIDLNLGRYEKAKKKILKLVKKDRSWENLARLANYYSITGDIKKADLLYSEAEGHLNSRQMRDYAWMQLQRGLLRLDAGNFKEAKSFFENANNSYTGYWLLEEHLAETTALLGNHAKAIEIYKGVINKTEQAEFHLALSELLKESDPGQSLIHRKRALELFQKQYKSLPEAVAGHWIEHALESGVSDLSSIQKLAEENLQIRPNSESKYLLAKTYLKIGKMSKAKKLFCEVESSPWRKPDYVKFKTENSALFVKLNKTQCLSI